MTLENAVDRRTAEALLNRGKVSLEVSEFALSVANRFRENSVNQVERNVEVVDLDSLTPGSVLRTLFSDTDDASRFVYEFYIIGERTEKGKKNIFAIQNPVSGDKLEFKEETIIYAIDSDVRVITKDNAWVLARATRPFKDSVCQSISLITLSK